MNTSNTLTNSINEIETSFISELLIGILMAFISTLVGLVSRYLTMIELWKDKDLRNRIYIWKYFLSKILFASFNCYMVY